MESDDEIAMNSPEPATTTAPLGLNPRLIASIAVLITVLLWGLSVALPVWETRSDRTGEWAVVSGYVPALLGWLGLVAKCPAWFANVLLVLLCITLFKSHKIGFVLSLVAFVLAASAYTLPALYGDNDQANIVRRLPGFYLWLGSFLTIALGHALLATAAGPKWLVAHIAMVMLMVIAVVGLERLYPVGLSPLETALKNPDDVNGLTAAVARNPPQAEKDAALSWAVRQDLASHLPPSKRVPMLLAAGANPNKTNNYGDTILIQALRPHSPEAMVALLVQAGADVNARGFTGKPVLELAQQMGCSPECLTVLVNAGARSTETRP